MYNVRTCACVIKLIKMRLLNKNYFSAVMKKCFKTPTTTFTKKRKLFINPLFFDKYGIADVSGKEIYVMCSKELAEKSLKPNKLQRHIETHANIAVLSEEDRKRVFHYCYKNLIKA